MNEMAGQESAGTAGRTRPAPAIVTPLTKVNLALPFSKITVEEPGKDLAELPSVVAALAAVLERTADDPVLPEPHNGAAGLAPRRRGEPRGGMRDDADIGRERLDHRPDHRPGGRFGPAADLARPYRRRRDPGWADTGQVHSGYVTTTTATYSTQ